MFVVKSEFKVCIVRDHWCKPSSRGKFCKGKVNGRSTRPGWDIGEGGPGGWSSRIVLIGIREEERLTNKLRT